jgi:hypothetical protein
MPQRVSQQAISTHVGRVIFGGQATSKLIAHKLDSLPADKLKAAMQRRGLGDVSLKKVSDVLSGKDKVGMKQHDLKRMVEVLQEVGVARQASSASHMVMTAAQEIQKGNGLTSLDAHGQRFSRSISAQSAVPSAEMKDAARTSSEPKGILARLRGVVGEMQKANRDVAEGASSQVLDKLRADADVRISSQDDGGIRGLRQSMRSVLGSVSKKISKP